MQFLLNKNGKNDIFLVIIFIDLIDGYPKRLKLKLMNNNDKKYWQTHSDYFNVLCNVCRKSRISKEFLSTLKMTKREGIFDYINISVARSLDISKK